MWPLGVNAIAPYGVNAITPYGINVMRLERERRCLLVLLEATAKGKKELIAFGDNYRENEHSWWKLLLDVKACDLDSALAIGDGAFGFGLTIIKRFVAARQAHERGSLHRRHPGEARRLKKPPTPFLTTPQGVSAIRSYR
jgi:hypothetical protein